MPASVVADRRPQRFGQAPELGYQPLHRPGRVFGAGQRLVQVGGVGRVVLVVMHAHRRLVDPGLEGVIGILKVGYRKSHSGLLKTIGVTPKGTLLY